MTVDMPGVKQSDVFEPRLIFLLVTVFSDAFSTLTLKTSGIIAQERKPFSLWCTKDSDLRNVYWIRNLDIIFKTQSYRHQNETLFDKETNEVKYQAVAGRLTVNGSLRTHNVTLWINSTLDEESRWQCKNSGKISNLITITTKGLQPTTVGSGVTTKSTIVPGLSSTASSPITNSAVSSSVTTKSTIVPGLSSTASSPITNSAESSSTAPPADGLIYIATGSVGGFVVVVVVIVIIVCVLKKKFHEDTSTKTTSKIRLQLTHNNGYDNRAEMFDIVLYSSGYGNTPDRSNAEVKTEDSDDTSVTDMYTQVQKKKTKTKVQETVNIEKLYARPVKKKKKDEANVSVQINVNVNIGRIPDD